MKKLACLLVLLTMIGCGFSRHIGNDNLKPELVTQIVKGKSTKQDILSLFGPPQTTSTRKLSADSNTTAKLPAHLAATETWSYWSHNIEGTAVVLPFYAQTNTKSSNYVVSIYFDDNGTVLDYSTTETRM